MEMPELNKLEEALCYTFQDRSHLLLALTHSSYANEHHRMTKGQYNERIEYLGDAVLELIVSDFLYKHHPEKSEDNTHLRYDGAVNFASLIAKGLKEIGGIYADLLIDDLKL